MKTEITLQELGASFEAYRISHKFTGNPPILYDAMQYIMDLGGKRTRPMLTLASNFSERGEIARALPAALAMEVFHNFSLIHDDILDNATIRRGKPVVHVKWNVPSAILAGDNLLIAALQMLLELPEYCRVQVLELLLKTSQEICEGQQMDMDFAGSDHVTEQDYLRMIRLKTAVLLGCSAESGALCAGADPNVAKLYFQFAEALGMAFQLQDDYLDTFGDPSKTGKKKGGDIAEGKKTWLYIMSVALGSEISDLYLATNGENRITGATRLFSEQGLDKKLLELSSEWQRKSDESLNQIKQAGGRTELLEEISARLADRNH